MRNDGQKTQGGVPRQGRTSNGFIPSSLRALTRIVSSGASSVASTVKSAAVSAASAIVDRDADACHDQVLWAGFDKLECKGDIKKHILLIAYQFGFQIWDVEEADNVRNLVSRHDGPVSFMQMLPKPLDSKHSMDRFEESRPLLAICADESFSGGGNVQDGLSSAHNGSIQSYNDLLNKRFSPTVVWFYSLTSQSYVHMLKFRSIVYSVRCSSRVVAVLQAAQIHCFDAATLEREYIILTNPIVPGYGFGVGPLAVGPRWIAYSGSAVAVSNSGRVCPQHLIHSSSFPAPASNGRLVLHYANESSRQLAAGIVTLGDMGYKKLSRYYPGLLPDGSNSQQLGTPGRKVQGIVNGHLPDVDNIGMVIVRDIVSKSVITQFRAHKSPISSLCFDPSGTLLVTASVQGHNINVFRIIPGRCGGFAGSDSSATYVHLYRLQRGITNAVIQDISFSDDSQWIIVSSSRGTSHLFAISPFGGSVNFQCDDSCLNNKSYSSGVMVKAALHRPPNSGFQMANYENVFASCPPVTLSVVSRIRSGNNGWKGTVGGAAAAATGRMNSFPGPIASAFHKCRGSNLYMEFNPLKEKCHLLVFSPSGCVIQYALRLSSGLEAIPTGSGLTAVYESGPECDMRLVVEPIQKLNICRKQHRKDREDNIDIYGENGNSDSSKVFPEGMLRENSVYTEPRHTVSKVKICFEERQRLYISEAELHVNQTHIPLWTKPGICFQPMMIDHAKVDEEATLVGEIEIEMIPSHMVEARSKDLIPVFDSLQTSRIQQLGIPTLNVNNNGQLLHQKFGLSESGSMYRISSGSTYSTSNGDVAVAELQNGTVQTGCNGFWMPTERSLGFVNNSDSPRSNTQLEIVNNRGSLMGKNQSKYVNNSIQGFKMENQFEDEGDEFD